MNYTIRDRLRPHQQQLTLQRLIHLIRQKQAAVEAARKAAGGVYDPILKKWVPLNA